MVRIPQSWRWGGEISGPSYLAMGVLLFAVKFLVDELTAVLLFGRRWTPLDYVAPGLNIGALAHPGDDRWFYGTMMMLAVPFTIVGVVLTINRLRSAGLSRWLVLLFFAPVVNLLFFVVASLIPARLRKSESDTVPLAHIAATDASPWESVPPLEYGTETERRSAIARWFPSSSKASFAVASILPVIVIAGITFLSTNVLKNYGWGLFIGTPFCVGLLAAVIHGIRTPRSAGQCLMVASAAVLVGLGALMLFAMEGLGCLIMFLPLAFPLALLGALLGYSIQKRSLPPQVSARVIIVLLLFLPVLVSAERIGPGEEAPLFAVSSAVEVNAPPEVVWRHVVDFPPLPEPREWAFRAGVAYPVRAEIDGRGVGAVRRCVFSTGAFIEPIEVWDAPRRLGFAVTSCPPAMKEWSFYSRVHPPHLEGFLVSERGEFRLVELPGGRTRLEGTTWYRHHMWPAAYWQVWSDYLLHRIHLRVLEHVKRLSESDPDR